jgi:hypothetical protein
VRIPNLCSLPLVLCAATAVAQVPVTNVRFERLPESALRRPLGGFQPVLRWAWTASATVPDALNVMSTPAVIDLNIDGYPDIVFGATDSRGGGYVEVGYLRALSGYDGSELFTIEDPGYLVNTASAVAVGDIDGDLLPEIIACASTGAQLMAFENDGTFKWISPVLEPINWGAPSLADLDGDGTPEIVVGRQALDHDGNLLWTGTGGQGQQTSGGVSLVADIDLDGLPNVVAGNTVYTWDGQVAYGTALPDGYNAVGNFDGDPQAEVVLVSEGSVHLLDTDLSTIWSQVLPGAAGGGPPTVADLDGDGYPDIAIADPSSYTVFGTWGNVIWTQPTQDASSWVTGSSAFDFEGDGTVELVYRDETMLRVYRGADGLVLWEMPMSSCTWHEYVLVADVDADFHADLVAVANDNCGKGPERGVFVFRGAGNEWAATRTIWNQYTYHITNVADDGTIPAVESNNWETYNNYRQSAAGVVLANATAAWVNYGRGWSGTGGVPELLLGRSADGGQSFELLVGNGSGQATAAVLLVGPSRARIATPLGGDLLVDAAAAIPITLEARGSAFAMGAPRDFARGQTLEVQVLTVDAGATHGVAFSKGLEIRLGR